MLNHDDADRAMHIIRSKYSAHYPKNLDVHDARDLFVFLEPAEFTKKFAITYNGCFKTANNFSETAEELVDYVNAFVASDFHNFKRKIYVKRVEEIKWGTCAHEYLHFLTHRNFYPAFYSMGGRNPDIVEGMTEYLTREADPELANTRTSYDTQYLQTKSWVTGSPGNLALLMSCFFQGSASPIT